MILVYKYENNYIPDKPQGYHVYRKRGIQRQDPSGSEKDDGGDEGGKLAGGDKDED
jgi:hypothetical protein